jgi:hypothetical protein
VLHRLILPVATRSAVRQPRPVMVVVAGQPGAGKTEIADLVQAVLDRRGGSVRVGRDLYQPFHRHYESSPTRRVVPGRMARRTIMAARKGKTGLADWVMRVVLWLYALVSIPLYLWFLHHAGDRWGQQLPDGDDLRFWLPIVLPLAGFSFTTISSTSWWWSTEEHPFFLGRKGWRFMMVFVVALSLMAGFFGSAHRDVVAVLL